MDDGLSYGRFAQGGERQSNYCFHYSLNFEPGLSLRGLQGFAGNYIITGGDTMKVIAPRPALSDLIGKSRRKRRNPFIVY